jgi:hypothetical protein
VQLTTILNLATGGDGNTALFRVTKRFHGGAPNSGCHGFVNGNSIQLLFAAEGKNDS